MQTVLNVLGVITWIVLVIAIIALFFNVSCFFAEKLVSKIQGDAKEAIRAEIANDILNTSWWFSESIEANLALNTYGKALMNSSRCCSSTMRDEWRKECAKARGSDCK